MSAADAKIVARPATAMPAIAPPAISPLEKSTPGPDSTSAIDWFDVLMRRSTSQRTRPPANIADEVEIGRYTPTATGSDCTPISSMPIVMKTPSSTSPQGSFWVRMPSVTSAMIVALGESSFVTARAVHLVHPPADAGIHQEGDLLRRRVDEVLARQHALRRDVHPVHRP